MYVHVHVPMRLTCPLFMRAGTYGLIGSAVGVAMAGTAGSNVTLARLPYSSAIDVATLGPHICLQGHSNGSNQSEENQYLSSRRRGHLEARAPDAVCFASARQVSVLTVACACRSKSKKRLATFIERREGGTRVLQCPCIYMCGL